MSKKTPKKSYDGPFFPHIPENEVAFTGVDLLHGWLGNMAPIRSTTTGRIGRHPNTCSRVALRTPEKATGPQGENIQEEIRAQQSPMGAKMQGKKKVYRPHRVIEVLTEADLDLMRMVLRLKVAAHTELKQKLLATGTTQIIENCTARPGGSGRFWGAVLNGEVWEGHNWLGKLWMELRENLVEEMATTTDG